MKATAFVYGVLTSTIVYVLDLHHAVIFFCKMWRQNEFDELLMT